MYSDAEAHEGVPNALLSLVAAWKQEGRRWGITFTNLDTLAAYHMEAIKINCRPVGYAATDDQDWYRRVALTGYPILQTGLEVIHHNDGASTVTSNPLLTYLHGVTFPLYHQYYETKWGGTLRQEQYAYPFNHFPLNPVPNYLPITE
ncbi:hypothetical protein [Paenibacillus alvei]|uniref:hypothetical protein n=1 Tax=Paenibacillus alvei TaxID=44250 RepID=UPI00165690A7|nr:hypothetical protein [Paenibacillus alvei]